MGIGQENNDALVAPVNGSANDAISDVIGNKDDNSLSLPGNDSLYGIAAFMAYHHVHDPSLVYPRDANPVNVVAGVGAWTEGAKTEIIAAGVKAYFFDLHFIILGNISESDDYVLKIYTGDAGSEIFWGECAFTRDTNQVRGSQIPIQGSPIPANIRVSATLLSGIGSNNVDVKIYVHEYPT